MFDRDMAVPARLKLNMHEDLLHAKEVELLGRALADADYVRLTAAQPGDEVTVGFGQDPHRPGDERFFYVFMHLRGKEHVASGQQGVGYEARYAIWNTGVAPELSFQWCSVEESGQRHRIATRLFAMQANNCSALGFPEIKGIAEKVSSTGEPRNGYYTWPLLGFDCPLTSDKRKELPNGLDSATCLLDLMQTTEGRKWWEKNGWQVDVVFSTAPDSPSMRQLRAYLKEKGLDWDAATSYTLPTITRE